MNPLICKLVSIVLRAVNSCNILFNRKFFPALTYFGESKTLKILILPSMQTIQATFLEKVQKLYLAYLLHVTHDKFGLNLFIWYVCLENQTLSDHNSHDLIIDSLL